jgi:hypothetical protein
MAATEMNSKADMDHYAETLKGLREN